MIILLHSYVDIYNQYFKLVRDDIIQLNNTLELKLLYKMNILYNIEKNESKCKELFKGYLALEI